MSEVLCCERGGQVLFASNGGAFASAFRRAPCSDVLHITMSRGWLNPRRSVWSPPLLLLLLRVAFARAGARGLCAVRARARAHGVCRVGRGRMSRPVSPCRARDEPSRVARLGAGALTQARSRAFYFVGGACVSTGGGC